MLQKLKLKGVYKSDQDDILRDFYIPALSLARTYDRAVGFFSASTINYAAQALTVFVRGDGFIRLIVGAFCDAEDIEAVRQGLEYRQLSEKLGAEFVDELGQIKDELFEYRFKALAWLVAKGRLEIRVALRPRGMYHDKVGIITDPDGEAIVFSGSANESANALLPTHNYESINVFPTWRTELADYYEPHRASFERLWENKSPGTVVIDIPNALKDRLLQLGHTIDLPPDPEREAAIADKLNANSKDEESKRAKGPRVPDTINGVKFELRNHQREALNAWRAKGDFQGIFDLATGAGKTITAVYAAVQMAKKIPNLTIVVAAPYQSLADQWCDILETFNIQALQCYVSKTHWFEELQRLILDLEIGVASVKAIVVVNRTLKSPEFQAAIRRIPKNAFLWIGDECHHHGADSFSGFLPSNARYRIGLSATPEHYMDQEKNSRLKSYYGDIIFTYSLKQAIEDKVLTPYNYFPTVVELTLSEAQEFIAISDEIAQQFARNGAILAENSSTSLRALLMKRARIIGSAVKKLPSLVEVLKGKTPESHSLYYCGDGQVDYADYDEDDDELGEAGNSIYAGRQIEVVSELLDSLGWKISRFTARESRREREAILSNFKVGVIDALVAIKCLDEGIDVPACSTAYILASARDPRQFIQRRGRILRRSPGKTIATIYDFVVVLPDGAHDPTGAARKLIKAELSRVAEFSSLANNRFAAYEILRPILNAYGLEHLV